MSFPPEAARTIYRASESFDDNLKAASRFFFQETEDEMSGKGSAYTPATVVAGEPGDK
jgi:hypothetical protein